jgi:hypothetical protein
MLLSNITQFVIVQKQNNNRNNALIDSIKTI